MIGQLLDNLCVTISGCLQCGASFMMVVSESRLRCTCHVPLFRPPVTSRAFLASDSGIFFVISAVILINLLCPVRGILVLALVICVCITPRLVSAPLWHLQLRTYIRMQKLLTDFINSNSWLTALFYRYY